MEHGNKNIKFLIDSGANTNLIKPGILKNPTKTKPLIVKCVKNSSIISSKGKAKLLDGLPPLLYYELDFHPFFDGLIGSKTLSKYNGKLNYEKGTLEINNKLFKFSKHFITNDLEEFNHFVTLPSNKNGDWLVHKPSRLTDDITIEPGLYQSQNFKTTIIIRTKNREPPNTAKIGKLSLNVNNFETLSPIPLDSQTQLDRATIVNLIRMEHLSKLEKERLTDVILENQQTLLKTDEKLTATTIIKHRINTKDDAPVYTKSYRYPHHFKKDVELQIQEMLSHGIIQHSTSPYSSPIWVVPKKMDASGKRKIRVVIDYRKINEKTIDDKFPIPQIEEILDNLGKSAYFTTIDLKSGFHQIEMDPEHREKTAFSTAQGHFEFTRMPFGLKNAPATFQRAMNSILAGYIGTICYVYLDDIIIIGYNLEDHLKNISKILKRLADFNLKIQLDKCEFLKRETEFLGHVITPEGIKPNPCKINKILEWQLPKTPKEIKQFLGLTGYYRRFIKDYSKITKPMTQYLKKGENVNLNDRHYQESFQKLKAIITSDQILTYPNFEIPFILTTDASNYALGAVLSQIHNKIEKPIAFASRTLNKTETNYSTTEKEALAIIWAVEKFKPYLYGNKFTLVTDHKPLVFIKNSNKNGKLIRWRLDLENYDYDVVYKTGKTNVVADALSRKIEINANELANDNNSDSTSVENNSPTSSSDTIHSANTSDDHYMHFTERALNNYRNQIVFKITRFNSILTENIFPNYKRITICSTEYNNEKIANFLKEYTDGRQTAIHAPECLFKIIQEVYREHFSNSGCHFVVTENIVEDVISETRQDSIIRKEHERAHRGISEVEKQVKRAYFFPKMVSKIRSLINSCTVCAQHKYDRKPYNIKISPRPIETAPFQRIHMDIFGIDKHYFLSLICAFSKHLQLIEIPSRNVTDIQNALTHYFGTFRAPKIIVCDHEASFTSIQLQAFLASFETKIEFASSSESNGQIEKTHSTIIELFNTNKQKFPDLSSPEIIRAVTSLYNESIHSATSFTPNEVIFNQQNLIDPNDISEATRKVFDEVKQNLSKAKKRMKKYNNTKEEPPVIKEGDDVYVKKITRKKLDPRFTKSKCTQNSRRTVKIGQKNVKRNKNKIKRLKNQ